MICYYCHWGWPKKILDIYRKAEQAIEDIINQEFEDSGWTKFPSHPNTGEMALKFGPAHTVWEDENFDGVDWNLDRCNDEDFKSWNPKIIEVIRNSLLELQQLPKELLSPPDEYDGYHPENFPPPKELEFSRNV